MTTPSSSTAGKLASEMVPLIGSIAKWAVENLVRAYHEYPNDEKLRLYNRNVSFLYAEEDEMIPEQEMVNLALEYIGSHDSKAGTEELIFLVPGGHGWKTPAWYECDDSQGPQIFNAALVNLGYETVPIAL